LDEDEIQPEDSLKDQEDAKSSRVILAALENSQKAFRDWQDICNEIDDIYSRRDTERLGKISPLDSTWADAELDLFWASYEILKPAIYAHAPKPVVAPQFKDSRPLKNKTAELLERTSVSALDRSNIDEVMCEIRDDLIFTNRGVMWIRKEGQKVCFEHKDRTDFRHEVARKWCEVGWVAGRSWMTRKDMRKRFRKYSGDAYKNAALTTKRDDYEHGATDNSKKASVWEVWHKVDNRVYWVSEGVDVLLDSSEPDVKLEGFFPCPKPAYGTLQRRSLVPVPDYERYASHFNKINTLTSRIYLLLDKVKMKGLIPAGGDVGNAIEELMRSDDDEILIPVPSASLSGDMSNFVQWLPIDMVATTIQGLISARSQLIDDFYQLSGISDIMRGATEAEETLGAQQLKTQYGSVRVREKIQELQRIARDAVRIAAEIIAETFTKETLLDMSQLDIPSKADIEKRIKDIEKAAEQELKALGQKAQETAPQIPTEQAQQAQQEFQQAQQAIIARYAPMLNEMQNEVPIEDIMKLLRDDKARSFAFEIEDGSTIWADEQAEKSSRNEFMSAFATASQALLPLVQTGPQGAKLAGAMLKFQLAPFRTGRELETLIDDWIDSVGQAPQGEQASDGSAELAAAQMELAKAEGVKAQAAMATVQARAAQAQAENERKMGELQLKAQSDAAKAQAENQKLQLQLSKQQQDFATKMAETDARINKMQAETAKILSSIGLDARRQDLEEYREARATEQSQVDTALKISGESRAERSQGFSEQQAMMETE
jgi:hypothetical protein